MLSGEGNCKPSNVFPKEAQHLVTSIPESPQIEVKTEAFSDCAKENAQFGAHWWEVAGLVVLAYSIYNHQYISY